MTDITQPQTPRDETKSKNLSLQRTQPPTDVPGFQTERFLGAGAYGEVWLAVDRNTGRKVAIKFFNHKQGVDWSLLSREVEKLVFLSADRYVVQLIKVGWEADPPWYVMEYVESGSLEDLLTRHGTLPVAEALELFREIAVGLSHAHGRGVLHCDLKPANILLDQDQRPRLADFGQSRLTHEQQPALGTLFYMAPEQADLAAAPDVRWDVYALGAIIYCLVVGRPPHRNDEVVRQFDTADGLADRLALYRLAIQTAPPAAEHRRVRGMDRALADLISRCLAPRPRDRYDNVQEVLDALAARDRARSQRRLMALGLVGPLVILLVTGFFQWRSYQQALAETEQGYREDAARTNLFAAELAAERVTSEIAMYFDSAGDEAASVKLHELLDPVLASPPLAKLIDPQATDAELTDARARFLTDPAREKLNTYLMARLQSYLALVKQNPRAAKFASLFIMDKHGIQLATALDESVQVRTIGQDLSRRPYFHGGGADLPASPRARENPPHIEQVHLSSVFKSISTGRWKIAVSAPIFHAGAAGEPAFEGVLALTINLRDLEFFRTRDRGGRDQFAVLIDGRPGDDSGAILQHPFFDELLNKTKHLPEALRDYRVPTEFLAGAPPALYKDPVGRHELAAAYRQPWIAAAAPVESPPNSQAGNSATGLVVLVQSDYAKVVAPVRHLGRRFQENLLLMMAAVFLVGLSAWLLALRLFREPPLGPRRKSAPGVESSQISSATTLGATLDQHR